MYDSGRDISARCVENRWITGKWLRYNLLDNWAIQKIVYIWGKGLIPTACVCLFALCQSVVAILHPLRQSQQNANNRIDPFEEIIDQSRRFRLLSFFDHLPERLPVCLPACMCLFVWLSLTWIHCLYRSWVVHPANLPVASLRRCSSPAIPRRFPLPNATRHPPSRFSAIHFYFFDRENQAVSSKCSSLRRGELWIVCLPTNFLLASLIFLLLMTSLRCSSLSVIVASLTEDGLEVAAFILFSSFCFSVTSSGSLAVPMSSLALSIFCLWHKTAVAEEEMIPFLSVNELSNAEF